MTVVKSVHKVSPKQGQLICILPCNRAKDADLIINALHILEKEQIQERTK